MEKLFRNFFPERFYADKTYVNQNRSNKNMFGQICYVIPSIIEILSGTVVSPYNVYCDTTSISIGSLPPIISKDCYQKLNVDGTITSDVNFMDQSFDQCLSELNKLKIFVPVSRTSIERSMMLKGVTNKVSGMSQQTDTHQKYLDKITTMAYFQDTLCLNKYLQQSKMQQVINYLFNHIEQDDFTFDSSNYDLSTIIYGDETNFMFMFDTTDRTLRLNRINIFRDLMSDFTNMFEDKTIGQSQDYTCFIHDETTLDVSLDISTAVYELMQHSPFDHTMSIFKENITGDQSTIVSAFLVPVQYRTFLCDEIPNFTKTISRSGSEWVSDVSINYGDYIYSILRSYYGFSEEMSTSIMKLTIGQFLKRHEEISFVTEVNKILENITGMDRTSHYPQSQAIRNMDLTIQTDLSILTPSGDPIIYHDSSLTIVTDVTMDYTWGIDDIYDLIKSINKIYFVHILDFGYDSNLVMQPYTMFHDKSLLQEGAGNICISIATNTIN